MTIELPKDAEGREIPLDTEVLYDSCGTKVSVKEFLSRTSVENQRTGWTIKAAYEGNIDYHSFRSKDMHLTQPDTWERLLEDLTAFDDGQTYGPCHYFHELGDDCMSCPARDDACADAVMRDVASRIRNLRGED